MKLSRMVSMMMGLVGLRVAGAILNLLSQIVFTWLFIPDDVGLIMLCMSTAAFASLFASLGYPWLAQTQLPRLQALGIKNKWPSFHGAFLRDTGIATIAIYFLVFATTVVVALSSGTKTALFFGCLSAPASILMRYDSSIANSLRRFTLSYAPDFVFRAALLLIYMAVVYELGWHISVNHAMIAFVVALYVTAISQAIVLGKHGLLPQHIASARPRLTQALRKRALPLAIVAAVATSFGDIVTLLGGLLLPPADVASLAVAIRLAALAGFVIQVTQQFMLPDIADAVTLRKSEITKSLLLRMNLLTIATICCGLLGTLFLGRFALSLFGQHYVAGFALLVTFMIGQSIRALSGMNQQLLSIGGFQTRTAVSCIAALAVLLLVSIYAVKSFGLIGIGYGVIAAELVWAIMLAIQSHKLTGQRGDIFWLLGAKL
jgi:O-antigen/teichoic acid export membrane protein